ncbi:MAG: hypothetical protein WA239_10290 [Candidatus Sulfotelmatobacter sp.]
MGARNYNVRSGCGGRCNGRMVGKPETGLGEINGDLLEADFGPVVRLSPVCVN